MNKNISMLTLIMSGVGILYVMFFGSQDVNVVVRITCIVVISILELINYSFKVNEVILNILQLVSILVLLKIGFYELNFLLPIVIFKIAKEKINIFAITGIGIGMMIYLFRENSFYISVYAIIINLYLYEVGKQYSTEAELKEFDRGQRYERHLMESKIRNLERYVEQNNVVTSLKERNFMAQKLHDHLGHRITSSLMQLEVTKETLGKDDELAYKYLITAMSNLREGMDEIREVLRNIKPREKVIGIENIREQLLKFEYSSGIRTTLITEGDINKLTLKLWVVIQENINEALTNAGKYSNADEIRISILVYNKIVRVEFKDNGNGYKNLSKGLGLRGIEERVQALGGRVEYCNDSGFVINVLFNLEGQ